MATRKSRFRLTALGVVAGAGVAYAVGGLTRRARGGALERSLRAQEAGLRRVATLVAQGATAEAVFDEVAGQVAALLGADAAAVQRYDPDTHATVVGNWGAMGRMFPVGSRLKLEGGSITASVYRTEQPARFDDYEHAAGAAAAGARQVGLRSAVGSPVFVAGRLWGAIVAGTSRPEPLPADTEHRIAQFTPMVATAISNFEARTEVQRLADEQAALRRVATLVARQRPPDEIFAQVAQDVGVLLGAETTVIHRYEADGDATVVGSWGVLGDAFQVGRRSTLEGDNVTASVHRTGRSARLDNYDAATGSIAAAARTFGARSAVGAPVVVNEALWGVIGASTSRAELMPADAERRLAQFAELVATTISNVQARTETQRLTDEQAALRRVAVLVAREASPDEVFVKVAEEVGPLLGTDSGSIDRFEPDGYCTVVGSWGALRDAFAVGSRWKLEGASASALVYRSGRPVRLDSYERGPGLIAAQARGAGLRSSVGGPIVVRGNLWGALIVATSGATQMDVEAEARIVQFAELVATAIANVEARSDLAASRARIIAAADEERRRVVRDLHDGAQQRLVHTVLTLKLARRAIDRDGDDAAALVGEALDHAQTATDELRELAHGILPAALTTGGLAAGVQVLASRMSIPVKIDIPVSRLPPPVEATAYFIVAEALTNVAKHAWADRATVGARVLDHRLEVEVSDDGVGGARVEGTGLVGLRDRVGALGGSLRVQSPAGGGTVIEASIPVG